MLDDKTREDEIRIALETVEKLNSYVATGNSLDRLARISAVEEHVIQEIMAGNVVNGERLATVFLAYRDPLIRIREYLDTLAALDEESAYALTPTFQHMQKLIATTLYIRKEKDGIHYCVREG